MKRAILLGRVAVGIAVVSSFAAFAAAEHPDIIHSFRLIPRHSTLEQTGGFAGVHVEYNLFGKFDIVTGYEGGVSCLALGCPPPPTHIPFAKFEDVRVSAVDLHSPLAVVPHPIPLEHFVDLEKLRGTFEPSEPRRLFFHGFDAQHQPFRLLAVQRGRLLHLLGANDAECCDLFNYKIDALAHIAPYADFNLDGRIDRNDSDRLLAHIGTLADATLEDGDADGDGDVDGDDFLTWQHQVGTSVNLSEFAADSLADAAFATAVVPEPASIVMWLTCIIISTLYRRHRCRG